MTDGFHIKYSPVNQAWFVMFGDSVQRIFNDKSEAREYLADLWRATPPNCAACAKDPNFNAEGCSVCFQSPRQP